MGIEKTIRKFCVQDAVYWGNPRPDGHGGLIYDPPKPIKCRWDDKASLAFSADGKEFVSKATVLVTETLDMEGAMWLGDIKTLPMDVHPTSVEASYIRAKDRVPMVRSDSVFVNIMYLSDKNR